MSIFSFTVNVGRIIYHEREVRFQFDEKKG